MLIVASLSILSSHIPKMWYVVLLYYFLSAALHSNAADYVLPLFILFFFILFFLFNSRSQKLPDRFLPNFQELCILV